MKHAGLFAGIGGMSLGLDRAGMETVFHCDNDPYCQKVLKKHWPDVPIHGDIKTLKGSDIGSVDIVSGGYPCQPFSVAGKRQGAEDDRYLWPEMFRIIQEVRPAWVLGENVAGHVNMGLDDVLLDLESEGYATQAFVIPACAVDAPHRRDRVWIVAHSNTGQCDKPSSAIRAGRDTFNGGREALAHSTIERAREGRNQTSQEQDRPIVNGSGGALPYSEGGKSGRWQQQPESREGTGHVADYDKNGRRETRESIATTGRNGAVRDIRWLPEPSVGRVAHGIPRRVDRLRSLGNAVVPQVVEQIGHAIMESA